MPAFEPTVYAERRRVLGERMREQGVDVLFCPPSGDLEYLTGARRRIPTFGNISYTHGWVCGAFFRPDQDPVFVLPRMVAEFDMPEGVPGDKIVVKETDDGAAAFERVVAGLGPIGTLAGRAPHLGPDGARPRAGRRRLGRRRHVAHQPDAPDQDAGRDRADGGGVPSRRQGDGRRHRRRGRRRARARTGRGGRQPAARRRLARRVVRHGDLGDGARRSPATRRTARRARG